MSAPNEAVMGNGEDEDDELTDKQDFDKYTDEDEARSQIQLDDDVDADKARRGRLASTAYTHRRCRRDELSRVGGVYGIRNYRI